MKFKFVSLTILFSTLLGSCKSAMSYSKLMEEIKEDTYCEFYLTKSGDGYLTSYYDFKYFYDDEEDVNVLYLNIDSLFSDNTRIVSDYFVELPIQESVPDTYYCLFASTFDSNYSSYETVGDFYISNEFDELGSVTFNQYVSTWVNDSEQEDAKSVTSMTSWLIREFSKWYEENHNRSLKAIGMFPNCHY